MEPLVDLAVFLLCVAVGCAFTVAPITDALDEFAFTGTRAAAAALLRLALPAAYFVAIILVYHRVMSTRRRPL
uniref:Uncharacterized protein n=1 Tax=Oryza glumipatula TaxID=40148 RepID=A0A0E0A6D0_9ORYZ